MTLSEWLAPPWPWYVAGPLLGLTVPLHLLLEKRLAALTGTWVYAHLRERLWN